MTSCLVLIPVRPFSAPPATSLIVPHWRRRCHVLGKIGTKARILAVHVMWPSRALRSVGSAWLPVYRAAADETTFSNRGRHFLCGFLRSHHNPLVGKNSVLARQNLKRIQTWSRFLIASTSFLPQVIRRNDMPNIQHKTNQTTSWEISDNHVLLEFVSLFVCLNHAWHLDL